jgi:hypothetical protein
MVPFWPIAQQAITSSTARASRPPRLAGHSGYDAGKKINGRKGHALANTDGLALVMVPGVRFLDYAIWTAIRA